MKKIHLALDLGLRFLSALALVGRGEVQIQLSKSKETMIKSHLFSVFHMIR